MQNELRHGGSTTFEKTPVGTPVTPPDGTPEARTTLMRQVEEMGRHVRAQAANLAKEGPSRHKLGRQAAQLVNDAAAGNLKPEAAAEFARAHPEWAANHQNSWPDLLAVIYANGVPGRKAVIRLARPPCDDRERLVVRMLRDAVTASVAWPSGPDAVAAELTQTLRDLDALVNPDGMYDDEMTLYGGSTDFADICVADRSLAKLLGVHGYEGNSLCIEPGPSEVGIRLYHALKRLPQPTETLRATAQIGSPAQKPKGMLARLRSFFL